MAVENHPPLNLLAGKTAVITGAGRGIGKVIAKVFAREGARVLVSDFTGDEQQTADEIGSQAIPFRADITKEADIEAMFAAASQVFGRIDASLHVAGNPGGRRGQEISQEEFDQLTSVHLRGMMFCTKHAVKAMAPTGGGSVVNFSALASFNAEPRISPVYAAAKAAVNSMTKSYACQYGPQSIRVNAIAPGFTLSEKNAVAPPDIMAQMAGKAALGRGGLPEEQAQVAAFLCSDRASFVSGVIIPVDGGWAARLA